jgi:phosphoadenosine phosphosulfate reductase
LSAEDRIRWAVDAFGPHAVLLSSMQKTASVLMHLFHRLGLENEVLFVDTGYHFRETLQLRDEFMRRYRLNLVTVYPDLTPERQEKTFERKLYLFVDGQKECCRLRKTVPYLDHMKRSGHRLTMAGLRRSEGGRRGRVDPLILDPRIQGYTLHPIFDWTDDRIEDYLRAHAVPEHPLHLRNYPSIGCECCTTPVAPGEDPRAGRWRHLREPGDDGPKYCNINFSDGSGI